MALEIERKFLVEDPSILITKSHSAYIIYQYYINENMRIRLTKQADGTEKAYITIKYKTTDTIRREWEFEIHYEQAKHYYGDLNRDKMGMGSIHKTRHVIYDEDSVRECNKWEIDVFHGDNEGLILAEIELIWEDSEFDKLDCLGKEVTNDERYYNYNLAKNPYKDWKDEQNLES